MSRVTPLILLIFGVIIIFMPFSYASDHLSSPALGPTALCQANLQVSLDATGIGFLTPSEVDNGSASTCSGTITLEVRRTDGCLGTSSWNNLVAFECCDASQLISVELRVTDGLGNSSICSSSVFVIDDIAPQITCPIDKTLDCDNPNLYNSFDNVSSSDNCSLNLFFIDGGNIDQCSAGTLTRTWTADDGSPTSNNVSCTQFITVNHISDFLVQFPANVSVSTCLDGSGNFGEPAFADDDCELIASSYNDVYYSGGIERTWTVINWCTYDFNNPSNTNLGIPQPLPRTYRDDGDGFFQYTQFISSSFIDNSNPSISCPSDITVNCSDPGINDYTLFGTATISDNCDAQLTETSQANFNNCTGGTITRNFEAIDANGNSSSCSQTISVVAGSCPQSPFSAHVSDFIVQFPANVTITSCPSTPINAGVPSIVNDDTELINISFEDDTLAIVSGSCYTIERTWTVVNSCIYDSNNPSNTNLGFPQPLPRTYRDDGDGFFLYIQSIDVLDNTPPVFSNCNSNLTFCDFTSNCEGTAFLSISATDACSPSSALEYSYRIDVFNDGLADIIGQGNDASGIYPYGTHSIYWTVEDGCGNVSNCFQLFSVVDCDNPTPVCLNGIVVNVDNGTCTELFASDVLNFATDNCTNSSYLEASAKIRKVGTGPLLTQVTFCPSDDGVQFVEIWVFDEAGNSNFCVASIDVNNTGCPDNIAVNNNPIISNSYANINITSNGVVGSSGDVTFSAGQTICLESGFEVPLGAQFEAFIGGCSSTLQASEENE